MFSSLTDVAKHLQSLGVKVYVMFTIYTSLTFKPQFIFKYNLCKLLNLLTGQCGISDISPGTVGNNAESTVTICFGIVIIIYLKIQIQTIFLQLYFIDIVCTNKIKLVSTSNQIITILFINANCFRNSSQLLLVPETFPYLYLDPFPHRLSPK